MSLYKEYERIAIGFLEVWEKGLFSYREVLAEAELKALLEKLRGMPVPKVSECKHVKKSFEKGVEFQIKAREIAAKYVKYKYEGATISERLWVGQVNGWLAASGSAFENMVKDFVSMRKKFQIYQI